MKALLNMVLTFIIIAGMIAYALLLFLGTEVFIKPEYETWKKNQEYLAEREKNEKENIQKIKNRIEGVTEEATEELTQETSIELSELDKLKDSELIKIEDYSDIKVLNYFGVEKIYYYYYGDEVFDYAYDGPVYIKAGTLKKLVNVDKDLKSQGYKLVIWAAYRDNDLQQKLRDHLKITMGISDGRYDLVAKPGTSWHQFGTAVDVTLETAAGYVVSMPSAYLDFSNNRFPSRHTANPYLKMLQNAMVKHGMEIYDAEWWHFNDTTKKYE